jgi:PKD repeat protein
MNNRLLGCYLIIFICLSLSPDLTAKDPEIIIPDAPPYLLEGSAVNFEVKNIDSHRLRWEFGDGVMEMGGRKISHVFKGRGNFNLRVSDLEGKFKDPVTLRVKIVKDDREIVVIGQVHYPGIPVKMEARGFLDRSVRWDFGEGPDQKLGRSVTHTYQRGGTYTVKATDWGGRDTKKIFKEIRINEDNRSLTFPPEIIAGEPVSISLINARGGDFSWEFSDGQRTSGVLLKAVVFKRPGNLKVTLTDQSGQYPPLSRDFTVKPDNRGLKTSHTFALPEEEIRFETQHFRGSSVYWDFGDGMTKNSGPKQVTHDYREKGRYTVTARDFNGDSPVLFSQVVNVKELSPDFRLNFLEIAFQDGQYYQVAPLKNAPPSYYVKMKAMGRGILRGKWIVDQQTIGLFQVLLHQGKIADLRGNRVPTLPMRDLGNHDLTIEFTNYTFPQQIPVIRYFITETDALRLIYPEPGSKVTPTSAGTVQLKWKSADPYMQKKWEHSYQIIISELPLQFLSNDQMEWKEMDKETQYTLDLSPYLAKGDQWLYWQVRAVKPGGDILTVSEVSTFKLVK